MAGFSHGGCLLSPSPTHALGVSPASERAYLTQPVQAFMENGLGGLPWFLPLAEEDSVNPFDPWGGFLSLGHCLVKRDWFLL
jgi:hypothetical protein